MSLTLQVGLAVMPQALTFTATAATGGDKSKPELPKSKEKPTFCQWVISYNYERCRSFGVWRKTATYMDSDYTFVQRNT